ncbi:MAG: WecB/TagA/CpsF family glycosyltransferase [Chloroflexi bacterium]|nr:WecB/TagA/CpsF family glycosyltransferase [Chloroflexota bacterium]
MPSNVSSSPDQRTLWLLGVRIHSFTRAEALARLADFAARDRLRHVVTVNPEFLVLAGGHPEFRATLNQADLAVADGVGVVLASWLLGTPLPARLTGVDLADELAGLAAARGYGVYLLGAAPGVAQQAAEALRQRHPGLVISGAYAGAPGPDEEEALVERINAAGPRILLVAFGSPQQELWIARQRERLQVAVAIGVGGAFDFFSGKVRRAPRWMRALGLEWLYRLLREPWRWRRMLRLPVFAVRVLLQRLRG